MFWKSKKASSLSREVEEILDDIRGYVGCPKVISKFSRGVMLQDGIIYNKGADEIVVVHERGPRENGFSIYKNGHKIFKEDVLGKHREYIYDILYDAINYLNIKGMLND